MKIDIWHINSNHAIKKYKGGVMMKKLCKRDYLINDTVEAFACNCTCSTCSDSDLRLDIRADLKQYKLEQDA
jgi:putative bacteriocin precursor